MSTESIVLLSTTNSTGNFTSSKQKGAGYNRSQGGLHTFVIKFSNWAGELRIQATLELFPGDLDWFDVDLTDPNGTVRVFDEDSTDYDDSYAVNTVGNFIWIRATGTISAGEITEIRYNT